MSEPRLANEVVGLTAEQMPRTITRIAREILEKNPGDATLAVVGIHTRGARSDGYEIRTTALRKGVPSITTLAGA
ncbi:MAG TPA: hypothetical protein VFD50_10585 [Thermoleophilia bacterium]|nr:hypothetical protein [Thermoleophilia bacterium]